MVGHGQQAQRIGAVFGSDAIEPGGLHLDPEDVVFLHQVEGVLLRRVEQVRGEDVADPRVNPMGLGGVDRLAQQFIAGEGRKVVAVEADAVDLGIGARAHADDHVEQLDVIADRAAGADPDQVLDAVFGDQLSRIDRTGRDAHAGTHHRHPLALVGAGKAEHIAHVAHLTDIVQEGLGDIFRSQRVAGQQDGLGKITGLGVDMRCSHRVSPGYRQFLP